MGRWVAVLCQGAQGVSGGVGYQGQGETKWGTKALVSPPLEAAGKAGPETIGQRWGVRGAGHQQPLSAPFSSPSPLLLPWLSFALLRSQAWPQLAWVLVPASFLCVTLGQGLRSGPQFPTHHLVAVASSQAQCCFAVAGHMGACGCC